MPIRLILVQPPSACVTMNQSMHSRERVKNNIHVVVLCLLRILMVCELKQRTVTTTLTFLSTVWNKWSVFQRSDLGSSTGCDHVVAPLNRLNFEFSFAALFIRIRCTGSVQYPVKVARHFHRTLYKYPLRCRKNVPQP